MVYFLVLYLLCIFNTNSLFIDEHTVYDVFCSPVLASCGVHGGDNGIDRSARCGQIFGTTEETYLESFQNNKSYGINYEQSDIEGTVTEEPSSESFHINNLYKGDTDHGYVEVREGAFMFWWLYYADGKETTAYDQPFIIWLQGGPGISTAYGIFEEIGPQDRNLQNRSHSWVKTRNVLFIDSPVGTGYSYVKNESLLVTTDENIASDLVELMKQFLKKFPKFKTVPTHIFSESYGGKVAPIFAYYLHKEIQNSSMTMNLKTVGLCSAFVSPKHSILAQTEYLFNMGLLDLPDYTNRTYGTRQLVDAIDDEQYLEAMKIKRMLLSGPLPIDVNRYNVLQELGTRNLSVIYFAEAFMNGELKKTLTHLNAENKFPWKFSNEKVFDKLETTNLRSSTNFVEKLLNETRINLVVFNGQLDAVVPLSGAVEWVHSLKWRGAAEFKQASRQKIRGSGNGQYKYHDQLSFWWIYKAGHMVPADNPKAMEHILNSMVDSKNALGEKIDNS